MSTYESAYKSLLQGVSQQQPFERLPGQLTAQVNMLSDPVTNLRRRPGLTFESSISWAGATDQNIQAWYTDIAGSKVHVLLNCTTGNLRVFNTAFVQEASFTFPYLIGQPGKLRASSVGNEMFLCNTGIKPTLQYPTSPFPSGRSGFFYVASGAFSKEFNITVSAANGAGFAVGTYTTPNGAGAGDAAASTPEYIATVLRNYLTAFTVYQIGAYVFVQHPTQNVSVTTSLSPQFIVASGVGSVRDAGSLPARLPQEADGYVCRVGSSDNSQYFKYSHSGVEWLESGAPGSPSGITNAPISLYWNGTNWAVDTTAFEGRLAGNNTSNPAHEFMTEGISGMATYQGRLVLMSGPLVSLSASGQPRRFFRKTVTNVVSSDAIEIGSSMNSSAAYEWGVTFQKDLVLFSSSYQALIPSGNAALTSATATVVPTSNNETDTGCSPIVLGRTLMYPTPRSGDFFGLMEMVPSSYTDSQYVSQDSTPHLPKYMGGRCRFAVSSSVANIALFAPSGDTNSLVVYEYHWDSDTKVQQSWHTWTFEYPVANAYFAGDKIIVVFVRNNQVVLVSADPRAGSLNQLGERRPFLDLNVRVPFTSGVINIPAWAKTFDPSIHTKLVAVSLDGALSGELIGTVPNGAGTALNTVVSWPSGTAGIGIAFSSVIVPSPPTVTDYNQAVVHGGKATLLRYIVGTENSSVFEVRVDDEYSLGATSEVATLAWYSPELTLGRGMFSTQSGSIVPCRTDLRSTAMQLSTRGTGEMNITWLEYMAKFHPKVKRR